MDTSNNKIEKRFYVKISFNEKGYAALKETVYFRNEMTIDFFLKWKWYFEYRVALIRVKNPRSFIELSYEPYEYILPKDKYKEKVKSNYISAKRKLTKFINKLTIIQENWNELFPIEEHPDWIKINEKLEYYQKQLKISKSEYDLYFS